MRTQVPTTRLRPSRKTRPCIPETQEGHFRSRMLLASSSRVRTSQTPKVEAALLGSQINGESPTRPKKYRPIASRQVESQHCLGVSIEKPGGTGKKN
jgi:hypothetical protein